MEKTQELKDIVVIYHANCEDGLGSAYAAWKKFGGNASYIPALTGDNPPEGLANKEIYILDYSYPKEILVELVRDSKSVVVIDHHQSAEEAVTAFPGNIFDLNHSGAILSWRFFHPEEDSPELLRYIEDGDLWKFALPEHREYMAALHLYPQTLETWNLIVENLKKPGERAAFIAKGRLIMKFEKRLVENIMDYKEKVLFEGHEVWSVNASRIYRSILGNRLAGINLEDDKTPLGIVYYRMEGQVHVSLRSHGDVDVSKIAEKYGGGGHVRAASFNVPTFAELPFTFIK